ncbi:YfhO family protein [Chloroflexota bacterium]
MTHRRRTWLSEAIIIVALMLLPLLFWWRLWAFDPADRAVIPHGDFTSQYYPLQLFGARELAEGRLPAWDPYISAGQPGLADIQTGTFYPLNLLPNLVLALLGLPFGLGRLTAQVVLHFSLASLFTYLFVRHLARRAGARIPAARFGGAVAALTFTYSGYLTSFPVQQLTILETAIWLPLILLFLDRAIESPKPGWGLILTSLALACALLAGHPQTAMYVVYATVAYGIFRCFTSHVRSEAQDGKHFVLRTATYVLLPLVVAMALAAIQLVPTLGFLARSTRAGLGYESVAWGFPLAEITHLLYPGYFGGSPQYVGILSMILAVAALFVERARRDVIFWIIVGAVAVVLAFGGHTFVYNLAYLVAPGFAAVRNQERIIFLFGFAVSVLAGYGALTLVQPLSRVVRQRFDRFGRGLNWTGVVFLALTGLWYFGYLQGVQQGVEVNMFEGVLRHHTLLLLILGGSMALFTLRRTGWVRRPWLIGLTLCLLWLNLFTVNWQFNLADPIAGGPFPETGLVSFLQEQQGTFRISSAGLLPGGSSAGVAYQLEDITANTPLRLDAFQQFEDQVGSWRQWQLLNVHYILDRRELDGPGLEKAYEEDGVKVYRVSDPLPRAWVVHDSVIAGDEGAIDLINAESFNPRATAVLPVDSDLPVLAGTGDSGSAARVIEASPGGLVLEVAASDDGLVVVSQPYYAGWQARLDGETVPISRVDYLLQGVPVTAGTHRVELTFHVPSLPGIVSVAVLVGCIAGLFFLSRRRDSEP